MQEDASKEEAVKRPEAQCKARQPGSDLAPAERPPSGARGAGRLQVSVAQGL